VQETFGLTPIEAMAAGLPCVVTDWDGYRDTVRDGVDGFRIATYAPRAGLGRDLAYHHANDWISYDTYISTAAQMTAVDLAAATEALCALIVNPDLRRRMGEAGRARAREVFDWSVIIPQYQALWAELAARRTASSDLGVRPDIVDNPRRLDPFQMFASYPTEAIGTTTVILSEPGLTLEDARARLGLPYAAIGRWALPFPAEVDQILEFVAGRGACAIAEIVENFAAPRRPFIERGVIWLAKFGLVHIAREGPFAQR
jgi:hypothetical protein